MYNFYIIYCKLCSEADISATKAATEIGLSNAAPTGWKNGKIPNDVNYQKIASYFTRKLGRSITVAYLKGEEPEQPTARELTSLSDIQRMSDDELLEYAKSEELALYGGEEEDAIDRATLELAAEHKLQKQLATQKEKAASQATDSQKEEAIHLIEEIKQKSPEDYAAAISYLRFLADKK